MGAFGKIMKFLGNFVGIVLSLVLSLALIVMLVVTPVLSGVCAFTRPETISKVVQEIDFAAIFRDSFQGEMSEEEKAQMEFFVSLTETQAFEDLVELYAIDVTNAFEEEAKPSVLTKEALRKIMNDNMDELIQIVRDMGETMGEDTSSYTDAELEEMVREKFEEVADRFLELAPTAEDLRDLMAKVGEEFSTDSSSDHERPNSGMEFIEDSYDTPSYDEEDDWEGSFSYDSESGTITTIIVNGELQSENGEFSYYVDPETGRITIIGGEGNGAVAGGGTLTLGKALAIQNGKIFVLAMEVDTTSREQTTGQDEIAVVLKLARMAKNGTLTLVFVGAIVLLALLICLFRWPRFKGIMWVSVVLFIGSALVAIAGVVYTLLPGIMANNMRTDASTVAAVKPIVKIIANSMYIAAAIYAAAAIVLVILFVLLRKKQRKQQALKAARCAQAEMVEKVADEAESMASGIYEVPGGNAYEEVPAREIEEPQTAEEIPVCEPTPEEPVAE